MEYIAYETTFNTCILVYSTHNTPYILHRPQRSLCFCSYRSIFWPYKLIAIYCRPTINLLNKIKISNLYIRSFSFNHSPLRIIIIQIPMHHIQHIYIVICNTYHAGLYGDYDPGKLQLIVTIAIGRVLFYKKKTRRRRTALIHYKPFASIPFTRFCVHQCKIILVSFLVCNYVHLKDQPATETTAGNRRHGCNSSSNSTL